MVVRFSSIGDIVLTTPVVRCLHRQLGAEVHFLTKASFAAVVRHNPFLHRVWTIDKELSEVAGELRDVGFDYLVDLHGNLRTLHLKSLLLSPFAPHPRPRIFTFDKLNGRKFLLTKLKIDRMPDVHIVDRYLATVGALGVTNDGAGLDYFIHPDEEVDLAAAGLPPRYLAFVIGAAHATKRLETNQLRAICAGLDFPVLLLGGPAEAGQGAALATGLAHVHNACGRFSLGGSASLVRQATAVLTHDTGLMHVAAAFRKPILSVWGNTTPSLGMYPYLPGREARERQRRQEVPDLACRPCDKIGYGSCPKGHFRCIRDQDPADILAKVRELLPA